MAVHSDIADSTKPLNHPEWDGVQEAFEKEGLAGITAWLVRKHGELMFAVVKSKLPGRQFEESRKDLFIEVIFGCARWIERDLAIKPTVLLSMPLKRLVLCKAKRIVARWLQKEAFWSRFEPLRNRPGITSRSCFGYDIGPSVLKGASGRRT
jgi:hypothetical protein